MEWYQAVIVFAVAFAVAYCMVPVSKKIAFRIGAIDYPGYRRMNRRAYPALRRHRVVCWADRGMFHDVPRSAVLRLGFA